MHLFLIHLYADCFIRSFSSLTSRSSFFLHSLILIINDDACLTSKQLNSLATCIIIIKTTASAYMDTQYTHTHRERGRERAQLTIPHRFKFHSKVAAVGAASVDVVAVVFNFHVDDGLTNEPRKRRTSLFLFFSK